MRKKAKTYQSKKSCKRCGGRERLKSNRSCVVCKVAYGLEYSKRPYVVEKLRRTARERMFRRCGVDAAEAFRMIDNHDGKCALCGVDNPGNKNGWYVDHEHNTGKVRGLLCHHCNTGLGFFKDFKDRALFEKIVVYLGLASEVPA